MPVSDYAPIFEAAGKEWGVDPVHLMAIAHQESGGKPGITSRAGAQGVMQIMPATGKELGLVDPFNPEQSIYAGAKYYRQMLDRYNRPDHALIAYNAGPARADAFVSGKGTLPAETLAYVPAVTAHVKRFSADGGGAPVNDTGSAAGESWADFGKRTGADAKAPAGTDESWTDFGKRTSGDAQAEAAPAKPQQVSADNPIGQPAAAPSTEPPLSDPHGEFGNATPIVPQFSAPNSAVPRVMGEAFGTDPLGMSPQTRETWRAAGTFPNADTSRFNPLPAINELIVPPLAAVGDLAMRAGAALFKGAQQAGMEVGLPRDIVAMPEAFMGSPGGIGRARPPNALVPRTIHGGPQPFIENPLSVATNPLVRAAPAELIDKPTPALAAAMEPLPGSPAAARAAAEQPASGPRSAGAAATPDAQANMPRAEMIAQRATAERERLFETQPLGVADTKEYVPGVNPTEANTMQDARVSRKEKSLESEMPQEFRAARAANNDARLTFYDDLQATPTLKRRLEETRIETGNADLTEAWKNKQPADPQPIFDTAAAILSSPDGRRPAVRAAVDSVLREMVDAKGNAITDPEMLYGVRKHVDDLLSPAALKDNPLSARVTTQLMQLKGVLDTTIEVPAPGFKKYLQNWAEASRPIDEMEVLQGYRGSIVDGQGRMTYNGVHKMLKDIVSDRAARGVNAAKSISDETMEKLFALHSDLRRVASSDDLARARGSDSVQNAMDIAKSVAGAGLSGVAHAAANVALPIGGSFVLNAINSARRAAGVRRATERALNPPRPPTGNPLAP